MGYIARFTPKGTIEQRPCSHEGIDHDSLDAFGYDWEQVGQPDIAPVYPSKIYLPQTTDELIAIIKEAHRLGEKLTIRSRGHSSNDLVLTRGAVLSTTRMNQVLAIDESAMTATLQAGVVSADVDDLLAKSGYGLPVIGDHNDITVGGFASVGGIGPASFRHGLFIDNVVSLQYVTFTGELIECSRSQRADDFYKVLLGLGQFGVIATMVCKFIKVDKYNTVLRNHRQVCHDVEAFIAGTEPLMRDPSGNYMIRAAWNDLGAVKLGHISAYRQTPQSGWKSLLDRSVYGYFHGLAKRAGTLPTAVDKLVKGLGTAGVFLPPHYATIKNVEFFSDRMVDSTVGDPTRWFIMLVPSQQYAEMFRQLYELACAFRARYQCFSFVGMYVKVLRSEYLSNDPDQYYCEMNLLTGITERGIQPDELAELVDQIDDLCLHHGALRYMHTKTGKDPQRRSLLDPNAVRRRVPTARPQPAEVAVIHGK